MHTSPAGIVLQAAFWIALLMSISTMMVNGQFNLRRLFLCFWYCAGVVVIAAHIYSYCDTYTHLLDNVSMLNPSTRDNLFTVAVAALALLGAALMLGVGVIVVLPIHAWRWCRSFFSLHWPK